MERSKLLLIATIALFSTACGSGEEKEKNSSAEQGSEMKADTLFQASQKKSELVRYPNGNKKLTGHYEDGKRHGVWSSWYKSGELKSELRYQQGQRHGFYKTWYKNGKVRYKGQYHHGERTGVWKYFNKRGELVRKQEFGNGEAKE